MEKKHPIRGFITGLAGIIYASWPWNQHMATERPDPDAFAQFDAIIQDSLPEFEPVDGTTAQTKLVRTPLEDRIAQS